MDVSPIHRALEIPIREYRALIDTGAQRTCLARSTIAKEGLNWHGKRAIQNVHDSNIHYLFWTHLGFWCDDVSGNDGEDSRRSYFALPHPVEVIDIADNYWFDAILGMDVIQGYDLSLLRNGLFELKLG